MARTARASKGGICYHIMNRGNRRSTVYHTDSDYSVFTHLMSKACERIPMRVLAYCLMPNHFHMVLWPIGDGDLSRWMQWLLTCHVRRYHAVYGTSGRVWQGLFKAFPIERDSHLLTVMRYVERNPVRAKLVRSAGDWQWSSISDSASARQRALITASPVVKPSNWLALVNTPQYQDEVDAV